MLSILLIGLGIILLVPWIITPKQKLESEPLGFGYFVFLLGWGLIVLGVLLSLI